MFAGAVERANARLLADDRPPLPERVTFHALRRTYVSVMAAFSEPIPYVMQQVGHTDAAMTVGVYAKPMKRAEGEEEALRALYDGALLTDVSAGNGADDAPAASDLEARRAA